MLNWLGIHPAYLNTSAVMKTNISTMYCVNQYYRMLLILELAV